MKSGKERREHFQKLFDEQYNQNGGSPVPPYEFSDFYRLCAEQQRQLVRFKVLELLTVGITLEEFIGLAKDPYTWYPNGVFLAPDDDTKQEFNPKNN